MNFFNHYLLIINIFGFMLYLVNKWLYSNDLKKNVDTLLTITSLLGGSVGVVIAIISIDRKTEKGNMMSRVFVFSMFVIQIIVFLVLRGQVKDQVTFAFWIYFAKYRLLVIYLVVLNLMTFIAFAIDKTNAIQRKRRIRNVTLLGLTFIGGSIGGLLAMYILRHKTNKDYYTVGVPIIVVMQIVVTLYFMNLKLRIYSKKYLALLRLTSLIASTQIKQIY